MPNLNFVSLLILQLLAFNAQKLNVSRDMTPEKIFEQGAWPSSRDPVNCMALIANSYKMVEAMPYTDFKFVSVPIKHG